jgi:hypothetical protein
MDRGGVEIGSSLLGPPKKPLMGDLGLGLQISSATVGTDCLLAYLFRARDRAECEALDVSFVCPLPNAP